jgi:hypothetical protein
VVDVHPAAQLGGLAVYFNPTGGYEILTGSAAADPGPGQHLL